MNKDELLKILQNKVESPLVSEGLPFNEDQKKWLGGFFSGLKVQINAAGGFASKGGKPITIIYGSQTGNAEAMAHEAATVSKDHGLFPEVLDMADIEAADLAKKERILVVTSTYGEGEMPDNAEMLWETVAAEDAPRFEKSFFSVLALGDTSYDGFCTAGKDWDRRLAELGAQRVYDRTDCDVDFEEPSMAWIEGVLPIITEKGSQEVVSGSGAPAKPKKSQYNRKNPLEAELITKRVLTGEGSSKEIVHYEFSLGNSGEVYAAGDALNIIPQNRPDLIEQILSLFGTIPDEVTMDRMIEDLELRAPSKELVELIADKTDDEELKRHVENNDNEALSDFLWGFDSYELINTYAKGKISFVDFLNTCKPLSPRAYSISSSMLKHENEVHLTIGSVRYEKEDRIQNGVASTFLADIAVEGEKVKCYFSPNKQFKIPEDGNLSTIMVGPGTGIAPFRAFLEEREATKAEGENWLFFGDRNAAHDFIYEDELRDMQGSGLLSRLDLAFSRDQAKKIYVQDKMIEKGAEFFEWLERGAYFYICGDAYRMAKDVDSALHQIIATHGNMSGDEAAKYVSSLKKQKRYVRDVY